MSSVFSVEVLNQLIQKQWILENTLDWFYQLRAKGEGVANSQLTSLWKQQQKRT